MSSRGRLDLFYNAEDHAEASNTSDQILAYKLTPSNRSEACLKIFLSRFKGGDILELGAGSGLIARSLISHGLTFNSYTLSDISDARLKGLAVSFEDSRVHVLKLDADSLPEDEFARYDAIIMVAVIEHLIDPLGALQQINKLLRPGGFVFIDTPNIAKFTRRVKLLLGRFPSTASRNEGLVTYDGCPVDLYDEGHLHYFTYRSLSLMLLERCGFSKIEKFGYFVGPNGRRIFGHKLADLLVRYWPGLFSEIAIAAYI